ncbi:MAG: MarC family protein, partial [Candidatus Omnitrophica bacterium]|nr:MarC family protein [Candidatus Omnitrophota bacterium]
FPAIEIAGGIILLLIALDMLQARRTAVKETKEEEAEGIGKDDIAVTPLAIPMLAGPGAITTVILLSNKAVTLPHQLILAVNILLVSVITSLILRIAAKRSAMLSVIVMKIITRLLGLLLTTIAVQFILNGIEHTQIFG